MRHGGDKGRGRSGGRQSERDASGSCIHWFTPQTAAATEPKPHSAFSDCIHLSNTAAGAEVAGLALLTGRSRTGTSTLVGYTCCRWCVPMLCH